MIIGIDDYLTRLVVTDKNDSLIRPNPKSGFQDASGEFPRKDYVGSNTTSKEALGQAVTSLSIGGADCGNGGLSVSDPSPSIPTFNKADVTSSGHSFEMDDTPGNERIIIKHRTGSGIELQADGTVQIVSTDGTVRVSQGGLIEIVEGNAKISYNGDLNLDVNGSMNMRVGGDYNLDIDGDFNTNVRGDQSRVNYGETEQLIHGNERYFINGNQHISVLQQREVYADILTTKVSERNVKAENNDERYSNSIIHHDDLELQSTIMNIWGDQGAIGGLDIDMYSDTISVQTAYAEMTMVAPSFKGKLNGWADNAHFATSSNYSGKAGIAGSLGTATPESSSQGHDSDKPIDFETDLEVVTGGFELATNIELMDITSDTLLNMETYGGLFKSDPTLTEVRSKLRDPSNYNNTSLVQTLKDRNIINPDWDPNNLPKYTVLNTASLEDVIYGYTPLGNQSNEIETKGFILGDN